MVQPLGGGTLRYPCQQQAEQHHDILSPNLFLRTSAAAASALSLRPLPPDGYGYWVLVILVTDLQHPTACCLVARCCVCSPCERGSMCIDVQRWKEQLL